ncbi:MAG TPA: hypothetical protein VGL86_01490 [Polyangia bacterium]
MRAAVLVAVTALALAGCAAGAANDGSGGLDATTGLVLSLHFDHTNVQSVALSGATSSTARRFGPYVVSEDDLPRNSTVGFVFDAGDAGSAMICGESHDTNGNTLASGCDTFDIVSDKVENGTLTLLDASTH